MKQTLTILTILFVFVGCSRNKQTDHPQTPAAASAEQQEYYTCPMHPSVISDRPGACPVCGMALVRRTGTPPSLAEPTEQLRAVSLSPTQRVLANVSTARAEHRTLSQQISAVGIVDVAEPMQSTVSARFRGRIEKLFVNFEGETVKRGQKLLELYSPDLLTTQRDFSLALGAMKTGTASGDSQNVQVQEQLQRATRERLRVHFGMTDSQVAGLESNPVLKSTVGFYSPIQGTVIQKFVREGQYVEEGTELYQLADLSRVWVSLELYEQEFRFVKVGQPIEITTESLPGEVFKGHVAFVDPSINPETRTVRVRTEFPNQFGRLKPKMFVKAIIQLPVSKALSVPTSAVLFTGKRTIVWVETKTNTFEPRDVLVGGSSQGFYEILGGLKEGESVAATGGYLLDSESTLQLPAQTDAHTGHVMKK